MADRGGKPSGGMRIRLLKRGRVVKSYKVKPDTFTIGSGKEATIRAAGVQGLAPKHALVWLDDGIPTLVPSAGCTVRVNGQEVQFARLSPEDVVSIGKLEMQIAAADGADADDQGLPSMADEDGPTVVSATPPVEASSPVASRPPAPSGARVQSSPSPAAFSAAFEPPRAPPPRAAPPPELRAPPPPGPADFDDDSATTVSRPVLSAGEAVPQVRAAPPRPAPQPQIQHKPTTLGVPLPKPPERRRDLAPEVRDDTFPDDFERRETARDKPVPSLGYGAPPAAPARVAPAPMPEPAQKPMVIEPRAARLSAPVLTPEPAWTGEPGYWDDDEDEDEDEWGFVEPFSLVEVLATSGPPPVSGAREKYVVAQVTRHSGGKLWRVVTVLPGSDYRPDPSAPPLLTMSRDGRGLLAARRGTTGRVWLGGREAPLASFQSGPSSDGQVSLAAGDHAILDAPEGKFVVQVFRPPRLATPGVMASLLALGILTMYAIGVVGVLGGLLFALEGYYLPHATPVGAADEEQYEFISQNDLTLIAPQNVDTAEEETVEQEIEDDGDVQRQEVPPETVPRTVRRARTSSSGGTSSAAAQLISALSTGGGGGASLRDVITNIDAVGNTAPGSAVFQTAGIISKLPGGEVKLARHGSGGGVSTIGGDALKASSPGIGALASSGRSGKVRGSVSRVSSLMRASGGQLDRGQVLSVINRHIGAITRCYERRLVASPGLSGRIIFSWQVTESGSVSGVSVRSSTLSDAEVASCISGVIRGMRFPSPVGGAVSISFPFVFRAVDF